MYYYLKRYVAVDVLAKSHHYRQNIMANNVLALFYIDYRVLRKNQFHLQI